MYSSWKCSAGVAPKAAPLTPSQLTLRAPEGLLKSLAEKWHLPKELIAASSGHPRDGATVPAAAAKSQQQTKRFSVSTTDSSKAEATAETALVAAARKKLSRGFETLLQCLAGLSAGSAGSSSLSRRELEAAASQWALALQLSDQRWQQLLQLLGHFWGLVDELTAGQTRWQSQRRDGDNDSRVSLAELLEGLRTRVRTGRDLMELRRRLLQLAGGLFAVLSAATSATAAAWTAQLLDALAAAVGAERAAEVRAALARAGDSEASRGRGRQGVVLERPSFGELRRGAWLRLVHDQFF